MQLYQLAMELDERSADVAERAEALGLGHIDPTAVVTDEQAATLRAAYGRSGPAPVAEGPITVIGAAAAPGPEDQRPPKQRSDRTRKIGIGVGCAAALVAVVAFFASQASPAEERREEMTDELAAWQDAPPVTVAQSAIDVSKFPPDQPRDKAKLCAALQTVVDEEASIPDLDPLQTDFTELRNWTTDRGTWRQAMADASANGPLNAVPDSRTYGEVWEHYFQALYESSDSDLRGLAEDIELNKLKTFSKDVVRARENWQDHILKFCPGLKPAA